MVPVVNESEEAPAVNAAAPTPEGVAWVEPPPAEEEKKDEAASEDDGPLDLADL